MKTLAAIGRQPVCNTRPSMIPSSIRTNQAGSYGEIIDITDL